jgi:hypothetical protein
VLLSEWKSADMKGSSKDSMSDQDSMRLKMMKQALHDVLMNYGNLLKDKVLKVFALDDSESHGLAIDLYWELLKRGLSDRHMCNSSLKCSICRRVDVEFNAFSQNYLMTSKFSTEPVMRSLLGALLDDAWHPVKPLPFNNDVVRPGIWKSYFSALTNSEESLFNECLQDAFSLILDNKQNSFDIAGQEGWVKWLIPYGNLFLS